ncbi:MAG: hypothetical protein ACJA0C_000565 [Candidatus Endobugula sp.]|jgi:hypothetical protein
MIKYLGFLLFIFSLNSFATNEPDDVFSIHTIATSGGNTAIVRFNSHTGEAYYRKNGKFDMVLDQTIIPAGSYALELMSWPTGWGLLRINTKTGEVWVTKSFIWQKIPNK